MSAVFNFTDWEKARIYDLLMTAPPTYLNEETFNLAKHALLIVDTFYDKKQYIVRSSRDRLEALVEQYRIRKDLARKGIVLICYICKREAICRYEIDGLNVRCPHKDCEFGWNKGWMPFEQWEKENKK